MGKPHGLRDMRGQKKLERETGFEPATSTLARSHSTTEFFPLDRLKYHTAALAFNPGGQIRTLRRPRRASPRPPRHRTMHACRLYGRRGVAVEPGPPLEARDPGEPPHELHLPTIH